MHMPINLERWLFLTERREIICDFAASHKGAFMYCLILIFEALKSCGWIAKSLHRGILWIVGKHSVNFLL